MSSTKVSEKAREARNKYMRAYRQTKEGKAATARANERYWKKKAAEMEKEQPTEEMKEAAKVISEVSDLIGESYTNTIGIIAMEMAEDYHNMITND